MLRVSLLLLCVSLTTGDRISTQLSDLQHDQHRAEQISLLNLCLLLLLCVIVAAGLCCCSKKPKREGVSDPGAVQVSQPMSSSESQPITVESPPKVELYRKQATKIIPPPLKRIKLEDKNTGEVKSEATEFSEDTQSEETQT